MDKRLRGIMSGIHQQCADWGTDDDGRINYVRTQTWPGSSGSPTRCSPTGSSDTHLDHGHQSAVLLSSMAAFRAAYGVDAGRALAHDMRYSWLEIATAITLGLPALLAEGLRPRDLRRAYTAVTGVMPGT